MTASSFARQSSRAWSTRALCVFVTFVLTLMLASAADAARMTVPASVRSARLVHHHEDRRSWDSAHHLRTTPRSANRNRAHAAIVGGSGISIEQAPWQVTVLSAVPVEEGGKVVFAILFCGGSVLDATHVITAASCLFNPETGAQQPAEDIAVLAGVSNIESETEATEQFSEAVALRVHPYFSYAAGPGAPDDVGVVTLKEALVLSSAAGSAVNAIGLADVGSAPTEGAQVALTGFGQEIASDNGDGSLNSLAMVLGFSRPCGGEADAVSLCASAATGAACSGDGGSGLSTPGATPTLIGTLDTIDVGSGEHCANGSISGFVNLTAPEVRGFIEGSPAPPPAPRGGGAVIAGVTVVGHSLTCEPGIWSHGPTFTYSFVNSSSKQVLQHGSSSTYALSTADIGRTILCEVQAANAGGTGVGRTPALPAIEAATAPTGGGESPSGVLPPAPTSASIPPPSTATETGSVSLAGTNIAVQRNGTALVKLHCLGVSGCLGKLTLTAKHRVKANGKLKTSTLTIATVSFSVEADTTATVKLKLDAAGRALLGTDHGRVSARLTLLEREPAPENSQAKSVQLIEQKTNGAKR